MWPDSSETQKEIVFNLRTFTQLIIDPDSLKSNLSLKPTLVMALVEQFQNMILKPVQADDFFDYFVAAPIFHETQPYRLAFATHRKNPILAVIEVSLLKGESL